MKTNLLNVRKLALKFLMYELTLYQGKSARHNINQPEFDDYQDLHRFITTLPCFPVLRTFGDFVI